MNRSISKLLILIFFFCTTLVANTGPFGLGVIIGEPTGISMKFWNSKTSAIDGAIAWSFKDESALHLHADYLLHAFNLINVSKGDLPLYYGLGVRLKLQEEDQLGIRIPLGMAYYFENEPLDIFFEIVPILELIPSTEIAFNAAIGIRYFF